MIFYKSHEFLKKGTDIFAANKIYIIKLSCFFVSINKLLQFSLHDSRLIVCFRWGFVIQQNNKMNIFNSKKKTFY